MSVPIHPPRKTFELPRQIHLTNVTLSVNLTEGQYHQSIFTENGSPPEPGISSETLTMSVEQAAKQEQEFIKARSSDLETLLLFATLFSAVLTAFVIESYKNLQEDPSAEVLGRILIAIQTNSDAIVATPSLSTSGKFQPTLSALRVNGFWFASLVISVSTAFLAILAKQWLLDVTESLSPDLAMRARQHQHRLGNMEKWKMSVVLAVIPVLLHLSLLLFFAGLIDFLWSINFSIAIVSASLAGVTILFYFATHLTSIIWLSSPYRTSLTSLGVELSNMIRIVLYHAISNFLQVIGPIILLLLDKLLRIISHILRVILKNQKFSDRLHDLLQPLHAALSAEPSRKKRQSTVTTKLASLTAPRISEEDWIRKHDASLDANILAALISRFPRWQNHSQTNTLAVDVFRFKHLLKYRTLFLAAGAASFLSRCIRSSTVAGPNEAQAGMLVKQWDVLCRLITEPQVEEEEDIPSPDDIDSDQWESQSEASRSIVSSGLCVRDGPLIDTEDLHLFSTTLRLQVLVSELNLYEQTVGASIATFYERLEKLEASHLDPKTGALLSAVNTTIFISLQWIWGSKTSYKDDIRMRLQHTCRGLEVLTAILSGRLTMPFPIKRQICWATYFLSDPERYCTDYPLVPIIRNVNKLSGRLSSLISPDSSSVVLYSALTIMESLLYSGSRADGVDQFDGDGKREYVKLIRALTGKYTGFIKTIRASPELISSWSTSSSTDMLSRNEQISTVPQSPDFQAGPARTSCPSAPPGATDTKQDYLLRLLNRIVRISGCLGFYAMERNADEESEDEESEDEKSEDVEHPRLKRQERQEVISHTLTFLQNVCALSSALPVSMQEDVWRMYYGTMRTMVHLQMGNWMLRPSGSQRSPSVGPTNQPTDPANPETTARRSSAEDLSHNPETDKKKSTYELPPPIEGFIYSAESHTFESLAKDLVSSLATAAADPTNAQRADTVIIILRGIAFLSKAPRVGPRDQLARSLRQPTVYDTVSRLIGNIKAAVPQPITGARRKDDDVLREAAAEALDALNELFKENPAPAPGGEAAGGVCAGAGCAVRHRPIPTQTQGTSIKLSGRLSSGQMALHFLKSAMRSSSLSDTASLAADDAPQIETTTASNQPVLSDSLSAPCPSSSSEPRPAIPHHDTSRTAVDTSQDDESVTPKVTPAPTSTPDVSQMV